MVLLQILLQMQQNWRARCARARIAHHLAGRL